MKGTGQSRKDPRTQMRSRTPRYPPRVISSQITHVDPAICKNKPINYSKQRICLATWNVRSLVSTSSKLFELAENIDKYKLNLLGLTETHMPYTGEQVLPNGSLLIHSGRTDGTKRQGVGLAISKKIRNSVISYTPVSERILTARLHSKQINFSVVVAYAPTEDADDTVKTDFYEQLSGVFDELPGQDIKLLLGDFNARVTSDHSAWPGVISKHSLHNTSNDNGTRLLDFCVLHELTIGGTLFEHNDIHKGTWTSPDGRTVTQIDHICISRKFSHSLLNVKVCRGADISSDHFLVRGFAKIKLLSAKKLQSSQHKIPAIEHLRDGSLVTEYNLALQNQFSCLEPEQDLETFWSGFKDSIQEVSMDVLGQKPKKRREEHLSSDTKSLLMQRSTVKRRDPTSDANKSEYSRLNKMVKKSCKADDNNWALRVAADL